MPKDVDVSKEKVRQLIVNYSTLVIECAMNKELKEKFYADPIPYLRDRVGMKFPEDAKEVTVKVDPRVRRWPIAYIHVESTGEWVEIDEAVEILSRPQGIEGLRSLGVREIQEMHPKAKVRAKEEIETDIDAPLEDCRVFIKVPFIDIDVDILDNLNFDDAQILLSTCC
jgi:hypothetical protein